MQRTNLDPKPTVGISPYAAFGGNPILNRDVFGDVLTTGNTTQARKDIKELAGNYAGTLVFDKNGGTTIDFNQVKGNKMFKDKNGNFEVARILDNPQTKLRLPKYSIYTPQDGKYTEYNETTFNDLSPVIKPKK